MDPFAVVRRNPYGEPVTLTLAAIGLVTALVGGAAKAGDAAAKGAQARYAAYLAAGQQNPCVERLNAQIASVPKPLIAITAQAKANKALRAQLEAQRDAYLQNPAACPELRVQGTPATGNENTVYYVVGGVAVLAAGALTVAAVASKRRRRRRRR